VLVIAYFKVLTKISLNEQPVKLDITLNMNSMIVKVIIVHGIVLGGMTEQ